MSFGKCVRCGETFHLRITSDEALEAFRAKEAKGEVLCFGCFRKLRAFDVVKVIAHNTSVPEAIVGDTGAVVMVHEIDGEDVAWEVECVLPDGATKWQGAFMREQIKWLSSPK